MRRCAVASTKAALPETSEYILWGPRPPPSPPFFFHKKISFNERLDSIQGRWNAWARKLREIEAHSKMHWAFRPERREYRWRWWTVDKEEDRKRDKKKSADGKCGPGLRRRHSDLLRAGSSGDQIPVEADFPHPSRPALWPIHPPVQ